MTEITDLGKIKGRVADIENALRNMNFGRALKFASDLREDLNETPLELINIDYEAQRQFKKAYHDKADQEIEAERARLAESYQARVDAKVAEELQRHDVAEQAKA